MPEVISSSAQIESLFWARPLPLAAMLAIFVGVVALSLYLYRRSWGLKPGSRALLGVIRMVVLTLVVATLLSPWRSSEKPTRANAVFRYWSMFPKACR